MRFENVAFQEHAFAHHQFEDKANGRKKNLSRKKNKTRQINTSEHVFLSQNKQLNAAVLETKQKRVALKSVL